MNLTPASLQWILLLSVGLIVGVGLGVGLAALRLCQVERAARRLPKRCPLPPRLLANSRERKVWRWLHRAFYDHHVMVKVAITRFTTPQLG